MVLCHHRHPTPRSVWHCFKTAFSLALSMSLLCSISKFSSIISFTVALYFSISSFPSSSIYLLSHPHQPQARRLSSLILFFILLLLVLQVLVVPVFVSSPPTYLRTHRLDNPSTKLPSLLPIPSERLIVPLL